jgi:hypothetical protein
MNCIKGSEVIGHGLIKILSQHLPGEPEENHEVPVRIGGVLDEIRTEVLWNRSLKCNHNSSQLSPLDLLLFTHYPYIRGAILRNLSSVSASCKGGTILDQ